MGINAIAMIIFAVWHLNLLDFQPFSKFGYVRNHVHFIVFDLLVTNLYIGFGESFKRTEI